MARLKIKDAPLLTNVIGTEKIPTGSRGDFTITPDMLTQYFINKIPFVTQAQLASVKTELEAKITTVETTLSQSISTLEGRVSDVESAMLGFTQDLALHIADQNNPHKVTKQQIGLGSVDNTSDINKPISNPTKGYIDSQILSNKTQPNYKDVRSLNIEPSSVDQTQAIITMMQDLASQGVRDTIYIPKGVRFSTKEVFANVPLGLVLKMSDYTNWGQSGYKNKFEMIFGGDTTADDTQMIIGSGHHPALTLLNTGTSDSHGGANRAATILHSVGISQINDPLVAQLLQFGKNSSGTKWQTGIRVGLPHDVAMADPQLWKANTKYTVGEMCVSDGRKVYVVTTTGVSGATSQPTGTGTSIADGTIVWKYVQAQRSRDATVFTLDEDGNGAFYGYNLNDNTTLQVRAGGNRLSMEVNKDGELFVRDYINNNRAILASNTTRGIYNLGVNSFYFSNVTGVSPNQGTTAVRVTNTVATNMNNLVLPTGQTYGYAIMTFGDNNTTVVHGAGFILKDGKSVTPPTNGVLVFIKNAGASSAWIEVSRSFSAKTSVVFDPSNIPPNSSITQNVTVPNVVAGDNINVSFTKPHVDVDITAQVIATNTVAVKFKNNSETAIDLSDGVINIKII